MKKIIAFTLLSAMAVTSRAQLTEGKKNIESLCGCFNVEFKYAETFSPDVNYKYHSREELVAQELALVVEKTEKKIVIQHLLIMGDTMVIKHWREDWEFEAPEVWKYQGDKKWTKEELKPEQYKGKWTQTVWEVDDAPRYQGVSEWVKADGKTFWLNTTDAPLPRREYTTRNDYNILRRGNRLVLTESGYIHVQDNEKVIRKDGSDKVLAQEKGYNIYKLLKNPEECAYAKKWWNDYSAFWTIIRKQWEGYLASQNTIQLKSTVNEKRLNQYFDDLFTQWNNKTISSDAVVAQLKTLLPKFADNDGNSVAGK